MLPSFLLNNIGFLSLFVVEIIRSKNNCGYLIDSKKSHIKIFAPIQMILFIIAKFTHAFENNHSLSKLKI